MAEFNLNDTGIFVSGMVVNKKTFQLEGKKPRNIVDILVSGHNELFSVSLPDTLPAGFSEKLQPGIICKMKLLITKWKGNTYFEALPA